MRLAFLTHEPFFPPSGGGSAEAVYLVEELRRRGHEVHVFAPATAEQAEVEARLGIRWHGFRGWEMGRYTRWRNLKYLLYPFVLARLVEREAADAAFDGLLAQHTISAVAAARLKPRLRVPVALNYLDFLTGFMASWPRWIMPRPVLWALNRYETRLPARCDAEAVLTVSDPLADRLAAAGVSRERLRPIYYGCDTRMFRLDETALARRADGPPVLLMHGSFDRHHLGETLLAAVQQVVAARPDARLRLIGRSTPALRTFLRQAERRGLREAVEWRDFVPYAEMGAELARATVGLVPYEPTPGTHCAFVAKVVEYLAVGLPVVATPLEAIRLYFRDEPLLRFADHDAAALAAAMQGWLDTPPAQRAAWAGPAAARIRRELDWRVVAARAVDFVEERFATVQRRGQGEA